MARGAQKRVSVDPYSEARKQFDDVLTWVDGSKCPDGHAELEQDLEQRLQELGRRVYQGRLDKLFFEERERVLKGRAPKGVARVRARQLETRFGRVRVRRHGFRDEGVTQFPVDRKLRLPREVYSHGLRRRVAEEVRTQSVSNSVDRVDETTAGHVPKRQAEQLMVRAAQDFESFYASKARAEPVNDVAAETDLLMLSSDAKGITVVPDALRDATRKEAKRARREEVRGDPTSTRRDRRHAKRMAAVTAVWDQRPVVRTPRDIVSELRGEPDVPKARVPRPVKKRIAATIQNSLPVAISEMFDEADRRDATRSRTTGVLSMEATRNSPR